MSFQRITFSTKLLNSVIHQISLMLREGIIETRVQKIYQQKLRRTSGLTYGYYIANLYIYFCICELHENICNGKRVTFSYQ